MIKSNQAEVFCKNAVHPFSSASALPVVKGGSVLR